MGKSDDRKKRAGDAQRDCVAVGECRPPHHGSKNTRHYCKGKIGVEHQWRWMRCATIPNESYYHKRHGNAITYERLVCIVCMKLDYRTRERCSCCTAMLHASTVPEWMKVPDQVYGTVNITLEETA